MLNLYHQENFTAKIGLAKPISIQFAFKTHERSADASPLERILVAVKVEIISAEILFGFVGGQLAIFVGRQSDNKLAIAPQFVARVSQ